MKRVQGHYRSPRGHWVGDGFPVRSLFTHNSHGQSLSPFLLLDYAGPAEFTPSTHRRGVGEHPHRGFETVTIVYSGEVAHRDSAGNGGVIGPGDVQWMTAGAGIVHEEFHSETFSERGGTLEMVQLWVNLPARDKMTPPRYQAILDREIPSVSLPEGAGRVRVIAGEHDGHRGPAQTFTPINVWDLRLNPGGRAVLRVPDGHAAQVVVLRGTVMVNDEAVVRASEWVSLDRAGTEISVEANGDAVVLLLSGEPIDEPIAAYGPFVMNTDAQIAEAIEDFNSGAFGRMPA
ncbi:MAG TPA: pirin family protein [Solimonas sp.]